MNTTQGPRFWKPCQSRAEAIFDRASMTTCGLRHVITVWLDDHHGASFGYGVPFNPPLPLRLIP